MHGVVRKGRLCVWWDSESRSKQSERLATASRGAMMGWDDLAVPPVTDHVATPAAARKGLARRSLGPSII